MVAAHKIRQAYKVMATLKVEGHRVVMDVVAWQHLSGQRAKRLIAQFDLNGSQSFEKAEAALAGNRLAPETIGGLFIALDGHGVTPDSANAKAVRIDRDSIEVMVLLRYVLPESIKGTVTIGLRKRKADTRGLEVSSLVPLILSQNGTSMTRLKPTKLRPGDTVSFHVRADAFRWLEHLGFLPFGL
jgi:hypothetical protein